MTKFLNSIMFRNIFRIGGAGGLCYLGWYNIKYVIRDVHNLSDKFYLAGHNFKSIKINNVDLTDEQLAECSNQLEEFEQFVRQLSPIPGIRVGTHKSDDLGFAVVNGRIINVPIESLFPPSVTYHSDKDIDASIIAHEVGHIVNQDWEKDNYIHLIKGIYFIITAAELVKHGPTRLSLGYIVASYIAMKSTDFYLSRRMEYRADEFAARNGYGQDLIKYFESKEDFNHDFLCTHPTYSNRIDNICRIMNDMR